MNMCVYMSRRFLPHGKALMLSPRSIFRRPSCAHEMVFRARHPRMALYATCCDGRLASRLFRKLAQDLHEGRGVERTFVSTLSLSLSVCLCVCVYVSFSVVLSLDQCFHPSEERALAGAAALPLLTGWL